MESWKEGIIEGCCKWKRMVRRIVKRACRMKECEFVFFKQKTAYEIVSRDWSSDVCSSDLDGFTDCDKANYKKDYA